MGKEARVRKLEPSGWEVGRTICKVVLYLTGTTFTSRLNWVALRAAPEEPQRTTASKTNPLREEKEAIYLLPVPW